MRFFLKRGLVWLGAGALIGLVASGCLSMADDITPPPEGPRFTLPAPTPPEASPPTDQPQEIPPSLPNGDPGRVEIEVLDLSGKSLLDENLEISLEGYDQFELVYQDVRVVPPDGRVVLEDVPFEEGRVFLASLPYGGAVFRSEIVQIGQESDSVQLQVRVYETTTDRSGLTIDRLHVLLDVPQPDLLGVVEVFTLSNQGQAAVVAASPDQASVVFPLPDGAASLQFEEGSLGQRFLVTEDGFGDTVPILPGRGVHQVVVSFTLPYPGNRLDYVQRLDYSLSASALIIPAGPMRLAGDSLEDLGVQSLADEEVRVYTTAGISQGADLAFRIRGKPGNRTGLLSSLSLNQMIAYGAGIAGSALLAAGIGSYFRGRKDQGKLAAAAAGRSLTREEILDSIIALEDLFQAGEISREAFQSKRVMLKEQLRKIVADEEE